MGCFASRAGHSIVELRVFEGSEVERQCLLENHLVDPLSQKRSQELLASAQPLLCGRQHRYQPELHEHPGQRGTLVFGRTRFSGANHGVDNQLSHPSGRCGDDTGD